MQKKYTTIDEYIADFLPEVQKTLEQIRQLIKKIALTATEAISYQIPTFKLGGNLVHFAAFKNHIGFYPTPSVNEPFKKELSHYEQGKGSIRFPLDQPMPFALIEKIVQFRVKEMLAKTKNNAMI